MRTKEQKTKELKSVCDTRLWDLPVGNVCRTCLWCGLNPCRRHEWIGARQLRCRCAAAQRLLFVSALYRSCLAYVCIVPPASALYCSCLCALRSHTNTHTYAHSYVYNCTHNETNKHVRSACTHAHAHTHTSTYIHAPVFAQKNGAEDKEEEAGDGKCTWSLFVSFPAYNKRACAQQLRAKHLGISYFKEVQHALVSPPSSLSFMKLMHCLSALKQRLMGFFWV